MEENNSSNNNNKMLKIPMDLHRRLKVRAAEKSKTLYNLTVQMLEKGLLEE